MPRHLTLTAAALLGCSVLAAEAPTVAQPARSTRDLAFFVGQWEGESTFLPAFTPGATPRRETIRADCLEVLAGNYIQCTLTLSRADGRSRQVMILWNYNEVSGEYEGLTLASNYGQESSYAIRWDAPLGAYLAHLPTRTPDGRPATERLTYRASADGKEITGTEEVRSDGAADEPWVETFRFVWRRTPASLSGH